jgi:hypothetical protein
MGSDSEENGLALNPSESRRYARTTGTAATFQRQENAPMGTSAQIKDTTIAAARHLRVKVLIWPPGMFRDHAMDLVADITRWSPDAGQRCAQRLAFITEIVPERYVNDFRALTVLHIRMILEHGVDSGQFKRGGMFDHYTA